MLTAKSKLTIIEQVVTIQSMNQLAMDNSLQSIIRAALALSHPTWLWLKYNMSAGRLSIELNRTPISWRGKIKCFREKYLTQDITNLL